MSDVNQEIREQVRAVMKERGITQQALADDVGIDRIYVNRMLNGEVSSMPLRWKAVLESLGLEIVLRPKS